MDLGVAQTVHAAVEAQHTMMAGRPAAARAGRAGVASDHLPSGATSAASTRQARTRSALSVIAAVTAGVQRRCQT